MKVCSANKIIIDIKSNILSIKLICTRNRMIKISVMSVPSSNKNLVITYQNFRYNFIKLNLNLGSH